MASRSDAALTVFRITDRRYPPFDGSGAYKWGSRWCNPDRHIIHATSSYALAVLENLAHFNIGELPPAQVFVEISIPPRVSRQALKAGDLAGWNAPYPNGVSEVCADDWYDSRRSAVLIVPSVLSPFEHNVLINEMHGDTKWIKVSRPRRVQLDGRLQTLIER